MENKLSLIRIRCIVILFIVSLVLVGCSESEKKISDISVNKIYKSSQYFLRNRNWKQAIIQLEKLNTYFLYYPFCSYKNQIQLDLIYAYYKSFDFLSAKKIINQFIRLNPMHQNIDYVIYMRGLTNMALDRSAFQKIFFVDNFDHDPKYIHDAFIDFSNLVHSYPNSKYILDATKRMIFLKNSLAKHEYSIACYYFQRGAWVAVVNRVEDMLRNYQDTQATFDALILMKNSYCHMKMFEQANRVAKIISFNKQRRMSMKKGFHN